MLDAIVDLLECPVCRSDLARDDSTLICGRGHSFDVARQGYVTLLSGSAGGLRSDSAPMLAARARVQDAGVFGEVTDTVVEVASGSVILDVGAGTGHHLAAVVGDAGTRRGVAVDLSKICARAVARRAGPLGSVVADVWRHVPVRTDSVDTVLSIFAPRNVTEFARVLRSDGAVVVVTPTHRHLAEIVGPLAMVEVDPGKPERLDATMGREFRRTDRVEVRCRVTTSRAVAIDLAMMGPSAYHTTPEQLAHRAASLGETTDVTVAVTVSTYHRR